MVGKLRFAALRCNLWIPAVALMLRLGNAFTLLGVVWGALSVQRNLLGLLAEWMLHLKDPPLFTQCYSFAAYCLLLSDDMAVGCL
jgi:hypothetical protein